MVRHARPGLAGPMKRYMRGQFDYLGIKSPVLGELLRRNLHRQGPPALADLDTIARELWALRHREFQYAATSLIAMLEQELPEEFITTLEYLLVNKSWWDTVDSLATGTVGVHFRRYPKARRRYLARWRRSSNLWLRRSAILFQLNYKEDTDFGLLSDIIRENLGSNEFFINKAIGWALRQYSRIGPRAVRTFVRQTALHPLSAREALKWLDRQEAGV